MSNTLQSFVAERPGIGWMGPRPGSPVAAVGRAVWMAVSSPSADSHLHLLALRFALLNIVALGLLGAVWSQGYVALALEADKTNLCVVIFIVFLAGLGISAERVWRTGRELDALARHHPGSALPRPIEELLAPLTDCEPSQRGNLLAVMRIQLVQRISVIRHIAGNLVLLGLIGTVVGFIIALSAVDPTTAGDVRSVAPMVAALVNGMSTALYTTLVGSILHIWLMCNHQLLASATARLLSAVATLVDSRRE